MWLTGGRVVPEGGIDQEGSAARQGCQGVAGSEKRWHSWGWHCLGAGRDGRERDALLLAEPTQLQLLQGGQKWAQQEGPMGSQCPPHWTD